MVSPRLALLCLAVGAGTAIALVLGLSGRSDATRPQHAASATARGAIACAARDTRRLAIAHDAPSDTIAFVRYARGSYAIFVMSVRGGPARRLSRAPAGSLPPPRKLFQDAPSWSPDGKQIAFSSDRDGHSGVYVMRSDGTYTRRLTVSKAGDTEPAWSADGRAIAFVRGAKWLYVMRPDGDGVKRLTHPPNAKDTDPAWSPDGTRIAFVRREAGIGSALFLIGSDGRSLCRLTPFTRSMYGPAWSPDGERIAFSAGDGSGFGIAVVSSDGRGPRTLTLPGVDFHPTWSPDGRRIVFTREARLFVMNDDGSHLRRLTELSAIDGSPAWRPTA